MQAEPPSLHRWSEPIVVQLAAADSEVVTLSMELDRYLNNLKVAAEKYHLISQEQWKQRSHVRELAAQSPPDDASEGDFLRWHVDQGNANAIVRDLGDQLQETLGLMKTHHGLARATIEVLRGRLVAIAESPNPGFWDFDSVAQLRAQDWGPATGEPRG
jgi:hypothetical protein